MLSIQKVHFVHLDVAFSVGQTVSLLIKVIFFTLSELCKQYIFLSNRRNSKHQTKVSALGTLFSFHIFHIQEAETQVCCEIPSFTHFG